MKSPQEERRINIRVTPEEFKELDTRRANAGKKWQELKDILRDWVDGKLGSSKVSIDSASPSVEDASIDPYAGLSEKDRLKAEAYVSILRSGKKHKDVPMPNDLVRAAAGLVKLMNLKPDSDSTLATQVLIRRILENQK